MSEEKQVNRAHLATAGLLLVGILVGGLITEVTLRITGLSAPPGAVTANEAQLRERPGIFVPGGPAIDRSISRFPHTVTINELGYRGPELENNPGRQTTTILFAGDSFTWGYLVNDEETLPMKLQSRLTEVCPGTRVLNAGVGGTTIMGQRQMILRGLELEPDLVLLLFYDNDVAEMAPPRFWEVMAENRRRKSAFPLSVVYNALNRSAAWPVFRRVAARVSHARQGLLGTGTGEERDDAFWEASMDDLRSAYAEEFRELARELSQRNTPLLMASYPSHLRLIDEDVIFNHAEWLQALAGEQQVPFLDLQPEFRELGLPLEDLYFLPWDGHARPIGYRYAAHALEEWLSELSLDLSWCNP